MNDNQPSGRTYPARPYLAASIAVLRDGRFLLAARANPPYEHIYSLPGGIVETGESLSEAAARELMEEVGVEVYEPAFVAPLEIMDRDSEGRTRHHVVIMVHAARWKHGTATTGPEAPDVRWVTLEEVDGLPTTPRLKEMLLQARAVLSKYAVPDKDGVPP